MSSRQVWWCNSISATDGSETTLSFDNNDGWHTVDNKYEQTGTWKDENGNVILIKSSGDTQTLNKIGNSDGYQVSGEEDLGTCFFQSEEEAKSSTDKFVKGLPEKVNNLLESHNWTLNSGKSSLITAESIKFADGSAEFTKGEYTQQTNLGTYLFKQGPSEGDWAASNHSGKYSVTVDTFSKGGIGMGFDHAYSGTLTIDEMPIAYKLTVQKEIRYNKLRKLKKAKKETRFAGL